MIGNDRWRKPYPRGTVRLSVKFDPQPVVGLGHKCQRWRRGTPGSLPEFANVDRNYVDQSCLDFLPMHQTGSGVTATGSNLGYKGPLREEGNFLQWAANRPPLVLPPRSLVCRASLIRIWGRPAVREIQPAIQIRLRRTGNGIQRSAFRMFTLRFETTRRTASHFSVFRASLQMF